MWMSISMNAGQKVRSGGCGLLPLLQYSNTPLFFGDKCEREEQRNTKRAEQRNLPVSAPPPLQYTCHIAPPTGNEQQPARGTRTQNLK